MNLADIVASIGTHFVYRKDTSRVIDSWRVMKNDDGKFYGDCEDFSLTVFWYLSECKLSRFIFNLFITHKYQLIWCKTRTGELHFYGKIGDLCFDNWTRKSMSEQEFLKQTGHKKLMRMFMPFCIPQMIKGLVTR